MTKNLNLGHQTFFSKTWLYRSLDIMISYPRVQYQKKLIVQSWEDLVTDGQADRQTDENDFIGRCPTNVDYPTNNLRILVGLFGWIAFQGLSDDINFLSSILSVKLRKKRIHINWGEKIMKIILRVSNRRLSVRGNINKIFGKSAGYLLWFSYTLAITKNIEWGYIRQFF